MENIHGSLFLRDLLLNADKTLGVLVILDVGYLLCHLKTKNRLGASTVFYWRLAEGRHWS